MEDSELYKNFKGAFTENFVLNELISQGIHVSASKEGVVHNRSFFVILTTDSFEALFISYFKPAGIR